MKGSIEKLRVEYGNTPLLDADLTGDPLKLFHQWLDEALEAEVFEPNGMALGSVSSLGNPSCRTVLLKGVDKGRLIFYTHYASRKGEQLAAHPRAAVTFWWRELYRQVCIEGAVRKVSRAQSKAYFAKRPKGAQLAALASAQSTPLATRAEIDEAFARLKQQYRGKPVPCPTGWGGYALTPDRVEFWQGRQNRLHDRFLYVKTDGEWLRSRLAP